MIVRVLCALGVSALLSGCFGGAIFTHVTQPLDVNFDNTPVVDQHADGDLNTLSYSIIQVLWGDAGIGQIAKDHGLTKVHYADLETLTVLGFWTQRTVHVYGER